MSDNSKSTPMDVFIYSILKNEGKFTEFGIKVVLGRPFRCEDMRQIVNLPFIADKLLGGQNKVYFRWREDLMLHTVHRDPNPSKDAVIIALAKFIHKKDRRAVDQSAPA